MTEAQAKDWNAGYANGYDAKGAADQGWASKREIDAARTEPDMSIVRRNQMPAPRFPVEVLGAAADWVVSTAASKAAPVDYVALSLLVTSAGVIGSKRRSSPWEGWDEPSVIWGANVGPPSVAKSPATDPCREALRIIERGLNVDWNSKLAKYETDKNAAGARRSAWEQAVAVAAKEGITVPDLPADATEPSKPTQRRLLVADSTAQRVIRLLAENPGGLICFRDELSGLFGSFDQYGGQGSDRAFWLEAYGGRPYRYDRVKDDVAVDVQFCSVSLLGGIQPDRLNRFVLSGDDDGLAARLLYAWPDPVPPRRPTRAPDHHALIAALRRLAAIEFDVSEDATIRPRIIQLHSAAADEFQAWWERTQWDAKINATGRIAGAVGKLDGITLRLAMALEFLTWAWRQSNTPEPEFIGTESVLNAIKLIEVWVRPTLERVFAEASLPPAQQDAMIIGRWLLKERPDRINAQDLRRLAGFPGPKDAPKLDAALELLVDARWLIQIANDGPGRPRKDFRVNPTVYV
jgi:hypothetical protein